MHPLLLETDLVLCVTAAETVLHGGPGALLGACGPETLRAADRLLAARDRRLAAAGSSASRSSGRWRPACPCIGTSLVLNPPRLTGRFRGYPYEDASLAHVARSPLRRISLLPAGIRRRLLQDLGRELTAVAAFAGPPSVAHAEALLRGIARRSTPLEQPLDAIVIGMPWKHQHAPRERLNPITVATVALGLALRLWRDAFPIAGRRHRDRAAPALTPLRARHPGSVPRRSSTRSATGARRTDLAAGEREAAADTRALDAYRAGRACHPLLPYVDWDSCRPALDRLGAVVVAGCRDHQAARTLGFVPTHGVSSALEMAHGRAGGEARIGYPARPALLPARGGRRGLEDLVFQKHKRSFAAR